MKLLLLKVLLQRRARDEGFTLPMVIALGLVMLLLGTTNIVKSNEENLNAITQNSTSDALAVAEVGVTKYRELLNQNRILTVHNHNKWTSNNVTVGANTVDVVGQTCTDMTTTPTGWEDNGTTAAPNDTTKWWEIRENIDGTAGDELVGSYRLVSYEYDIDGDSLSEDKDNDGNLDDTTPDDENGNFNVLADVNSNYPTDTSNDNDTDDDGESDALGILTVQGRSTDGSEAQIRVEIPLRINQEDMASLAPALWIGSSDTSYTSNLASNIGGDATASSLTIPNTSNIVLSDGASSGSSGCTASTTIGTKSVVSDARQIPSIADLTNIVTNSTYSAHINNALPPSTDRLGNTGDEPFVVPTDGSTFDKTIHCKNISNCRYYYSLSTTTDINTVMETDGIAKVTLYVDGNLNINQDIGSNVSSSYLEIYVTSAGKITIDSDSVNTIKAFIHAPGSELEVTGSGTVNIQGSVWVDKFINGAQVNFGIPKVISGTTVYEAETTRVSSKASVPSYEVYSTISNREPRPLTNAPTNWIKEEVK